MEGPCKIVGGMTPEWTKVYVVLDSNKHALACWKDKKGFEAKKAPLKEFSLKNAFYDADDIPRKGERSVFSIRVPELVIFSPQPEKKEIREELTAKWIKAIIEDGLAEQFNFNTSKTPHSFLPKHFHVPTWCQLCSKFLWGLGNQGQCCSACSFIVHKECKQSVQSLCGHYQKQSQITKEEKKPEKLEPSLFAQSHGPDMGKDPTIAKEPLSLNQSFSEDVYALTKETFKKDDLPIIQYDTLFFGSVLGEGGFGKVYDGKCTALGNRKVAVKAIDLSKRLNEDEQENKTIDKQKTVESYLESLKSELKTLRNCVHPNILQFFGVSYDHSGQCLIITEQLATDLYKLLIKGNPKIVGILPKINFCKDAAEAMTFMHEREPVYLHLDLKPSNMLIDQKGKVKLCDFGLASVYFQTKKDSTLKKETGHPVGTINYMPPEFLDGTDFTPQCSSDVYSFTISMWEIFYQRPAWSHLQNLGQFAIVGAVTMGQRPPIEDIPLPNDKIECTKTLKNLFQSGWHEDPKQRITMAEMSQKLEDILLEYGVRDESGRKFWNRHFKGQMQVSLDDFFKAFCKTYEIPKFIHPEKAEKIISLLLTDSGGTEVALEKFGYFLDWYGPLESIKGVTIWDRACQVITHPSFYAELTKEKAVELLTNQPAGTYLTRVSFARPFGQFALTFKSSKGQVLHKRFRYNRTNQTFTTASSVKASNFTTFCVQQKWGQTPFTTFSPFLFAQKDLDQPLDETNYLEDYSFYATNEHN